MGAFHRYRRSYLKFSSYDTNVSSGGQVITWLSSGKTEVCLVAAPKGNLFIITPQKEAFATKLPVARERKTTAQGR